MLTIGNFDGVHRGHRALLQGLQEEGRKRSLPVMVMIFEPQPLELFATDKAPARLTRMREKLRYLAECGVDYVLCVRFDRRFAALTAQNFISDLLVKHLRVKFLAVGDDFRFGAGREGDFLLLQKAGAEYGFDITSTQTFCEGGVRISSTAVRQALAKDPQKIFNYIQLTPVRKEGIVGYAVKPGADRSLFDASGFKEGDIAIALNQQDFTDPRAMIALMRQLPSMDSIQLTVLRKGARYDISIALR